MLRGRITRNSLVRGINNRKNLPFDRRVDFNEMAKKIRWWHSLQPSNQRGNPEKPGCDVPSNTIPDGISARPPPDDNLICITRCPEELNNLIAVVKRGRKRDLDAFAIPYDQVKVNRQNRGLRSARGVESDLAVPS